MNAHAKNARDAVIETDRLRLAPLGREHAGGPYLKWMNDPEIVRFLEARFRHQDQTEIADYIETANADDRLLMFGIFLKSTGVHIGNIKLGPINRRHRRADVGFLIGDKNCWGNGYASEAIRAVAGHALTALGLHKVTAGFYQPNEGSRRALLNAGFVEEGFRPQQFLCDGEWVGEVLVGRLA
jgi:RimJ/RimL family protein N-acetyltransferase